jgi:hypothetical protein
MATIKISALPAATTADAADLTIVVTDIGAGALQDQKATVTQAATYSRALTGATTASAIVGSGASLIVNTALADSDTRIAGTTSATLFFVDAGLDKVGIATAVPTQKLDVTGTVNATLFAGSGASLTGLGTTSTAFRTVAADPSPLVNGDVWYNSTSDTFKCRQAGVSLTWSANAALPAVVNGNGGQMGTASACLSAGGQGDAPGYTATAACNTFNGTAWSATTSMTYARYNAASCGTPTAALQAGGSDAGNTYTETFNGTTWSAGGACVAAVKSGGSGGTATAAFFAGGGPYPPYLADAYKYNGTSWTVTGSLTAGRVFAYGAGTATAGIVAGGYAGGYLSNTDLFNGTTWASSGTYTSADYNFALCGTQTATQSCGGSTYATVSKTFNGSTWSSGPALDSRRGSCGLSGTTTTALAYGGDANPGYLSTTSLLSIVNLTKTFTVA